MAIFICYFLCPESGFVVKIFNAGLREMGNFLNQKPSYEYPSSDSCKYYSGMWHLCESWTRKGDDRKHWLMDTGGCGSQNNVSNLALHEWTPSKRELTQSPQRITFWTRKTQGATGFWDHGLSLACIQNELYFLGEGDLCATAELKKRMM